MRKTYCRLRDKKVSLGQLEQSEDMKKLRQAKSTTKERMAKTVRKYPCPYPDSVSLWRRKKWQSFWMDWRERWWNGSGN